MSHHHGHDDDPGSSQSAADPFSDDAPDVEARKGTRTRGPVEPVLVHPRAPRTGRPRVSTLVLMSVWVAALLLYLELRPGG
jgi:hypothetical protein